MSDLHALGQIYKSQGLVAESTINKKFIDRLKSISINSFKYLSPSWNEFAKISEKNFIDPYNNISLIAPNCRVDFNDITKELNPRQTAPYNKRTYIFAAILLKRFTIDIESLYKPDDITILDFSAIVQYHYYGGLTINSTFYKELKPNLISSINIDINFSAYIHYIHF